MYPATAIAIVRGCSLHPDASSIQVNASRPAAAGQRPSRCGYSRGCQSEGRRRSITRPIARHGLRRAKDSPEQCARERHANPEGDEDKRRGDVVQRTLGAGEAGDQHRCQRSDADHRGDRIEQRRPEGAAERSRQRAPTVALQTGLLPEKAEGEKRDDQDHERRPDEQPLRNREVGALNQSVARGPRRNQQDRGADERHDS